MFGLTRVQRHVRRVKMQCIVGNNKKINNQQWIINHQLRVDRAAFKQQW